MTEKSASEDMPLENRVLIIDEDNERVAHMHTVLGFIDYRAVAVDEKGWQEQLDSSTPFAAVIVGACSSPAAQEEVLQALLKHEPRLPLFMLHEGDEPATDIHPGILGYIELPIKYNSLSSALQKAQVFLESNELVARRRPVELFRSLVGSSRKIKQVRHLVEQVAVSDATALILGESGTGKEVVARNIHYYSKRRNKPFVPINCGAIPPDLLESELFGHEKGAFTGAISARQGRFEMAEGGTLFLDEIGDMPMPMQVKILRVLQERCFERVGSNKTITTNVRVVAATHRNLEELIEQGGFREDLYYRINVFPIEMPPLKERVEDIPLLVTELISRIEHEKRGSVRIAPSAVMALCQYSWPGNVRELANLIERLAILYPFGVADVPDLPEKFREAMSGASISLGLEEGDGHEGGGMDSAIDMVSFSQLPREGIDLKEHLSAIEVSLIRQALDESDGVVAHAAKLLSMRRTTLVEKLRKYGLQRTEEAT